MGLGGVIVDCACGLGAEVAGLGIEIERADAVAAASASELHAAFDALDSIGFHCLNCSPLRPRRVTRWWGGEGNRRESGMAVRASKSRCGWSLGGRGSSTALKMT